MNVTAPKTVADSTLPLLVALVAARKQARWQWKHCADEHKHTWQMVLIVLDKRINAGERVLAGHLDIPSVRIKREIVE
ncbi:MAG: hypothetical protein V3W44_10410 [Dehalococcoidales bacterium]